MIIIIRVKTPFLNSESLSITLIDSLMLILHRVERNLGSGHPRSRLRGLKMRFDGESGLCDLK